MRSKDTIEFIGLWETLNNPNFKPVEFEGVKNEAGANAFTMSPKKRIESTNAMGIVAKSGRYGGTYAHSDQLSNLHHRYLQNLNCTLLKITND